MDKQEILENISFGAVTAEFEQDHLRQHFLETKLWTGLIKDEVDIVYGAKGSGKSAHYLLLLQEADSLRARGIVSISAENPSGAPAFAALTEAPPVSETGFINLWKLYLLTLIGDLLKREEAQSEEAAQVIKMLEDAELIERERNLKQRLMSAIRYVQALEIEPSVGIAGVTPAVKARIELTEPTGERAKQGYVSIDALLGKANLALEQLELVVWILMDRLDAAFSDNEQLEGWAIRGLYRTYVDLATFKSIQLKIFLRTDIWDRILEEGKLRELEKQRPYTIEWTNESLFNLMMRRFLQNETICALYSVNREEVLADYSQQEALFARVFPTQVEPGDRQSDTWSWMLSRITDGKNNKTPRELIHLLNATRDAEMDLVQQGRTSALYAESSGPLFSPESIKQALVSVSRARLTGPIYAEYPALKSRIEELHNADLRGERYTFSPDRLAQIWGVTSDEAVTIANQMEAVGLFERKGKPDSFTYWLPFLYRDALEIS